MKLPSPSMVISSVALFVALGGGAYAVATIDSSDVKNNSLRSSDVKNNTLRSKDITDGTIRNKDLSPKLRKKLGLPGPSGNNGSNGSNGANGPTGQTGGEGHPGATGPPGDDALTRITSLPGPGFDGTNVSVIMTPDGVRFGPYADGGANGGSLYYSGLNGHTLSEVKSLIYRIRYSSDGDCGGVCVPYLRIFLNNDSHDAIFSPNTQQPDPDLTEGEFHNWVPTSGTWRYDDDPGNLPDIHTYADLVTDHGTEVVSGIYITTGFTNGTDLTALLRSFEVNGENFVFGG